MAQQNRITGQMIATLTIGGVSFILSAQEITIEWEFETKEARALKDLHKYPIGLIDGWTATGTFFIDYAATTGGGGPGGTLWTQALANAQVAVVVKDNAQATAGDTLQGNALITRCSQVIKVDDFQTIAITLTGQGTLASVIA